MTLSNSAHDALVAVASGGGGEQGSTAYVIGIGAFVGLLLLLWITTRFNRDR
ncbi:hypothetical protein [Streptomyces oceani]|uniref:hypothetical protein n=1 Tax=Streptomyces oceani TaxID=1075402 RepID=UPI00147CF6A8|nr:hypothetical protein [Streptomyces oceani]